MGAKPRKPRSDDDLKRISKHLIHELRMLQQTCQLARTEDDGAKKNAYLSSFAIHARNLLDFFYSPSGPQSWPRPDDVIAEDFFSSAAAWQTQRPVMSSTAEAVRLRVGKEIAHLTYDRLLTMSKGRPWANSTIANELRAVFQCFRAMVPASKLGTEVAKFFAKKDTP